MSRQHPIDATRPATMSRWLIILVIVVLGFLMGPGVVMPLVLGDRPVPAALREVLPEAKRTLASQLELGMAHLRFVGAETREADRLVVLRFELRPFPYLASEGAYLVSRCTPLDELDPWLMSGGRGVTDFETDPELVFLRSDAQPACEAGAFDGGSMVGATGFEPATS